MLPIFLSNYEVKCPIVLGGNLSVGSNKAQEDLTRYFDLGITEILANIGQIVPWLNTMSERTKAMRDDEVEECLPIRDKGNFGLGKSCFISGQEGLSVA